MSLFKYQVTLFWATSKTSPSFENKSPVQSELQLSSHSSCESRGEVNTVLTEQLANVLKTLLHGQRITKVSCGSECFQEPEEEGSPGEQAAQAAVETGGGEESQPTGSQCLG